MGADGALRLILRILCGVLGVVALVGFMFRSV